MNTNPKGKGPLPCVVGEKKNYSNLPLGQRTTQRLVDEFNTDERLWKKLEPRRRLRRKRLGEKLSKKQLKELDLREFSRARLPQDCIGTPLAP